MKPPIIVAFDALERTVTLRFDEPIIDKGFALGAEYEDPQVAQLKGAIALGQENCDAEYNRLRAEREEAKTIAKELLETLKYVVWALDEAGVECFGKGRARAAIAKAEGSE